jgi:hypothetical protein
MTADILVVLTILLGVAILIIFEIVQIDLAALLAMITLTWTGVSTAEEAFSGLSSNAVIAVMILGHGMEISGLVKQLSVQIVRKAGNIPKQLIGLISSAVGFCLDLCIISEQPLYLRRQWLEWHEPLVFPFLECLIPLDSRQSWAERLPWLAPVR